MVRDAYIWRASHGSNHGTEKKIKDPQENQVCLKFFFAFYSSRSKESQKTE